MTAPVLTYHPNNLGPLRSFPPCVAEDEVVVCTFPVYPSDDTEMPDVKRHALGRLFAASPKMLLALEQFMRFDRERGADLAGESSYAALREQVLGCLAAVVTGEPS